MHESQGDHDPQATHKPLRQTHDELCKKRPRDVWKMMQIDLVLRVTIMESSSFTELHQTETATIVALHPANTTNQQIRFPGLRKTA